MCSHRTAARRAHTKTTAQTAALPGKVVPWTGKGQQIGLTRAEAHSHFACPLQPALYRPPSLDRAVSGCRLTEMKGRGEGEGKGQSVSGGGHRILQHRSRQRLSMCGGAQSSPPRLAPCLSLRATTAVT